MPLFSQDELYEIDKELLYTGDYNMIGSSPVPPVQGYYSSGLRKHANYFIHAFFLKF